MWSISWIVSYQWQCQSILVRYNCKFSHGVTEPSVATLWSLYREVSNICSWEKCYYHKLTLNGPPSNRYLYSETRPHLLDESQASGKGSGIHTPKSLCELHEPNLPFLYIRIIWYGSVGLLIFYLHSCQEEVNFKNACYGKNQLVQELSKEVSNTERGLYFVLHAKRLD